MQKIKSNYLPKAIFIFAMFDILDMKLVRHYLKIENQFIHEINYKSKIHLINCQIAKNSRYFVTKSRKREHERFMNGF